MATAERVLELYRDKYPDFNVRHFHEKLKETEGIQLSYSWVKAALQTAGLVARAQADAREVFKAAIAANAAAIVLVHNHPSGDPTPSEADIKVTRDLIRAGQLLKIAVLDHVIIGRATPERPKDYVSLRELGYFYS
jgi:DNA repair protein RadC